MPIDAIRPWGLKETTGFVMLMTTLITLVFTAGYNWRRIDEVAGLQADTPMTYQRRDVASEQYMNLTFQIAQLRSLIEQQQSRTVDRP